MNETQAPLPSPIAAQNRWRRWFRGFRGPWRPREMVWLACCPLFLIAGAGLAERYTLGDSVLYGVELAHTQVTGVSREAVKQWFNAQNQALARRDVVFEVGKHRFSLRGSEIALQLNPAIVDQVLAAGRSGNGIEQLLWRLARCFRSQNFAAQADFDKTAFSEIVTRWERGSLSLPREATIRVVAGHVQRMDPAAGERVDLAQAEAGLLQLLSNALEPGSPNAVGAPALGPLTLTTLAIAPKTSAASALQAEAKARALIAAPIRLKIQYPAAEIQPPLSGSVPEETLTTRQLGNALRCAQSSSNATELILSLDPAVLDHALRATRARHEQKAKSASFDVIHHTVFRVKPSRVQTRISTEQAASAIWAAAETESRVATLELSAAEAPRVTTDAALQMNIHELLSQYTTRHPCCQPRVTNIHRIAELMDGVIIAPGETFSVNEFIGPRTEADGFVPAPTIVFGEMDDTVGGGVSQFATTLFNAVLEAGYEIIERQPHTYYFERYPIGNDATLSIPKPDLIFRNDTRSGMLIKTDKTKTSIGIRIYGDREGRSVQRSVSQPTDRIDPEVELIADDSLDPSKEEVVEKGAQGFTIEVTRTLKLESGEVQRQTRKVIYRPRVRRVHVHSCRLPKGHAEYTGKACPVVEPEPETSETP
jgi:vancomycin resistance protein YoaR